MHGHSYRVIVSVQGEPDPDQSGLIVNEMEFRQQIAAVLGELDLRSLNDMLAPAIPSVAGVAGWLWERLALHYSDTIGRLDEVTVWQDELAASVRR